MSRYSCRLNLLAAFALAAHHCAAQDTSDEDTTVKLKATRKLSSDDEEAILTLAATLINKSRSLESRKELVDKLNAFRHVQCYPGLLAVARDRTDDAALRKQCVAGLGQILDKRSVGFLIGLAADERVGSTAHEQLMKLTRHEIRVPPPESNDDASAAKYGRSLQTAWKEWWKVHADDVKFD